MGKLILLDSLLQEKIKITYKNGFLEPGQSHQDEQPHQPLQVDLPVELYAHGAVPWVQQGVGAGHAAPHPRQSLLGLDADPRHPWIHSALPLPRLIRILLQQKTKKRLIS